MRKKISVTRVPAGLILGLMALAACATTGGPDYAELAAQGIDVFAGKNWNATRRNNMYDRWEFTAGGSFQFWHIHHGEPLDRGLYRYELRQGILTAVKEGTGETAAYTYTFSGKTVTLTPVRHGGHQADAVSAAAGQGDDEHGAAEPVSSGRLMGALPDAPVTFTEAR